MKIKNVISAFAIATIILLAGCTKDDIEPNPAPTVISSDPANNAADVAHNKIITVTFSEAMNPLTLTATTFTIHQGTTPLTGTVSYSGTTASFIPTTNLTLNTVYTGTITIGAEDILGMALENDYVWTFTAGDILAPTVISTQPDNNTVNVALNKIITATFSEAMEPSTINTSSFTLKQGETSVEGAVSYSGTTASFTPNSSLTSSTIYTAMLSIEAKNPAGVELAGNTVWSFTTGSEPDDIEPTVSLIDPLNEATGVERNKTIAITFSEAMDLSTINGTNIVLKKGEVEVPGTLTNEGMITAYTPTELLDYATIYSVSVSTDVKDIAGNALEVAFVSSFTTINAPDEIAPTITSTDPSDNAIDIARNKVISIRFSEEMDVSTINASTITLNQAGNAIQGTVAYNGNTATFNASTNFSTETLYTVTVTTGVQDIAGNALEAITEFSFTTIANTAAGLAAVDLGTSGNYVILAKTAINNNPTSAITGDLGLSPAATSYITGLSLTDFTGYATSAQITGKVYAADMVSPTSSNLTTAVENMITAYNDAAGRPTPDFLELGTGNLGGKTLVPGLYKWTSTVTLPSDVTISGGPNDVWIFQVSGDLNMSSAVNLILEGGAQAKNIFWQVSGEATFGATAHFEGIILSMTTITFQTGASFNGRALAQTAVILDGNTVVQPQ